MNNPEIKKWKDYHPVLKPFCVNCENKGIGSEEYKFCSTEKAPFLIFEEDAWGRKGKQIGILEDIYKCNVYQWVIFQGPSFKN